MAYTILINWNDLALALQQLLGYSYRVGPGMISRVLPWQAPYCNQLWVKNIAMVKGLRQTGVVEVIPGEGGGGVGAGFVPNTGPWNTYQLAQLTLHFWRPPYFVRTDKDIQITGEGGSLGQREWLRYFDKHWEISTNVLSRETSSFRWSGITITDENNKVEPQSFPGSVGQMLPKMLMRRTWYQVPETALFASESDATPNGLPLNLLYTQHQTKNPITGYVYPAGVTGGTLTADRSPIVGCVNAPIGSSDPSAWTSLPPYVDDSNTINRFLGCPMGTLLLLGATPEPAPLQLPSWLMQIPSIGGNEAISQTQYNVTFTFAFFDPPSGNGVLPEWRGHNLMPYSGDSRWYPVESSLGKDGVKPSNPTTNPALTPFNYADFSDLFYTL